MQPDTFREPLIAAAVELASPTTSRTAVQPATYLAMNTSMRTGMRNAAKLVAACLLTAGAIAAAGTALAQPRLSVQFIEPQNYMDASYSQRFAGEKGRAEVQRDIVAHLQQLADRGLRPGESMAIEVLDIDLAGRFDPFRPGSGGDVRILSDVTWPRITLRSTLTQAGQTGASREEKVIDQNYMTGVNRYSPSDRLRYEKAMLDTWFERRVAQP